MIIHWNWRVFDLFRQIRVDWAYDINHPWNLSLCYSYPPVKHETSPMDCIRIKVSIWLPKGKPKNNHDDRVFPTMFLPFFRWFCFAFQALKDLNISDDLRRALQVPSGPAVAEWSWLDFAHSILDIFSKSCIYAPWIQKFIPLHWYWNIMFFLWFLRCTNKGCFHMRCILTYPQVI